MKVKLSTLFLAGGWQLFPSQTVHHVRDALGQIVKVDQHAGLVSGWWLWLRVSRH
jgi:hypothetical protein